MPKLRGEDGLDVLSFELSNLTMAGVRRHRMKVAFPGNSSRLPATPVHSPSETFNSNLSFRFGLLLRRRGGIDSSFRGSLVCFSFWTGRERHEVQNVGLMRSQGLPP